MTEVDDTVHTEKAAKPAAGETDTDQGTKAPIPHDEATDNSPSEGHQQRQQGDEDLDEDSKSTVDSQGMK